MVRTHGRTHHNLMKILRIGGPHGHVLRSYLGYTAADEFHEFVRQRLQILQRLHKMHDLTRWYRRQDLRVVGVRSMIQSGREGRW